MQAIILFQLVAGTGFIIASQLYRNRYHPVAVFPLDGIFFTLWLGGVILIAAAAIQQQQISGAP